MCCGRAAFKASTRFYTKALVFYGDRAPFRQQEGAESVMILVTAASAWYLDPGVRVNLERDARLDTLRQQKLLE